MNNNGANEAYSAFLEKAKDDPQKTYVVVDGIPRSGTNFLRNICSTMTPVGTCLQHAKHFFNRYEYSDGMLHGENLIHLFPLRENIMNSLASVIILNEVFLRDRVLQDVAHILKTTRDCLSFAISEDVKNLYFIRLANLASGTSSIQSIFEKHGVEHKAIDIGEMVTNLSKDEDPDNFRSNRFPMTNASKDAEMLAALEILSLEIFSAQVEEIKKMHESLLPRSL